MKLIEFVKMKHDYNRIANTAMEVRSRIIGCKTQEQRETARAYVNNWKKLMYSQEKLDKYKGLAKMICRILGNTEHWKCMSYIDGVHELLMSMINNDIQ